MRAQEQINYFPVNTGNQKQSFMMSADKIAPSPVLLEALADSRSMGEVVCQRQIPSGALLGLGVSSAAHRAHFPELHSFIMSPSIGGKPPPEELPLPSIQLPGPLISARTAHNEKERLALTSSTGICDDDNG